MTDLRKAAQQALEAWDQPHGINYVDFRPYMDALRAALAEPVQEPLIRDDIIRMAREAGGLDILCASHGFTSTLEQFAVLVAAAIRARGNT